MATVVNVVLFDNDGKVVGDAILLGVVGPEVFVSVAECVVDVLTRCVVGIHVVVSFLEEDTRRFVTLVNCVVGVFDTLKLVEDCVVSVSLAAFVVVFRIVCVVVVVVVGDRTLCFVVCCVVTVSPTVKMVVRAVVLCFVVVFIVVVGIVSLVFGALLIIGGVVVSIIIW